MRTIFIISMLSLFVFCSTGLAELVDNGDGTLTDTKTGLMWQKAEAGTMTWKEAIEYSDSLVLAGHSDWRLPDPGELQSLFDSISDKSGINKTAFPDISWAYWSSTSYVDNPDYAITVSFGTTGGGGVIYQGDKRYKQAMRAVRGGQ